MGEADTPDAASQQMSKRRRHFSMALVAGTAVAVALLGLAFAINPDRHPALSNLLFTAQYPGWLLCAYAIPGSFESSGTENYLALTVLVNSVFYTTVFSTTIILTVALARVVSSYRGLNQAVRSSLLRPRRT